MVHLMMKFLNRERAESKPLSHAAVTFPAGAVQLWWREGATHKPISLCFRLTFSFVHKMTKSLFCFDQAILCGNLWVMYALYL